MGAGSTYSSIDLNLSRSAAGVLNVGTGASGNASGTVQAANFIASNSIRLANNTGIQFTDTGATLRTALALDNGNVLRLEQLSAGHLIIKPASGDQLRFTNNAESLGIMTMFDSTEDISLGTNTDSNFKLDLESHPFLLKKRGGKSAYCACPGDH
jgi:hypothetical protein